MAIITIVETILIDKMIFQHFSNHQIIPFIFSVFILLCSIVYFQFNKTKISLLLLFLGALGLGYFIANLDPFLILWDEQYHALVAKNLTNNPFKPMLYSNPIMDYDYRNWTANHIWLHKQPLFLWQIALSLKLFGYNALAVRLPSILLHAILPLMIYRIGKISCTATVGYYGALFFTVAYFPLELVAGRFSTDHNDVAFLFYIVASFWAWFEYQHTKKSYWLILIGLFSGFAVLVKWLVGLLIYAVWFFTIGVNDKKNWIKINSYFPISLSFIITLIVFIPWQIYILYAFKKEADYELLLNSSHFLKSIENHGGDVWFHFKALKTIYGSGIFIPYLYLLGLILFIKKIPLTIYRIAITSAIIIIYTFYSLASTKMISFCIIAAPFAFLGLGSLIYSTIHFLQTRIKLKKIGSILQPLLLIVTCAFLLNLSKIANYHTMWKPNDNFNRKIELAEMDLIKKLKQQLANKKCIIFNVNDRLNGQIPIMFYTDYVAYNFIPTKQQLRKVKDLGYMPVVIVNSNLPNYIKNDLSILKINH